jgi:hypothetical protein
VHPRGDQNEELGINISGYDDEFAAYEILSTYIKKVDPGIYFNSI